jgi:hypothetical protein
MRRNEVKLSRSGDAVNIGFNVRSTRLSAAGALPEVFGRSSG